MLDESHLNLNNSVANDVSRDSNDDLFVSVGYFMKNVFFLFLKTLYFH